LRFFNQKITFTILIAFVLAFPKSIVFY